MTSFVQSELDNFIKKVREASPPDDIDPVAVAISSFLSGMSSGILGALSGKASLMASLECISLLEEIEELYREQDEKTTRIH